MFRALLEKIVPFEAYLVSWFRKYESWEFRNITAPVKYMSNQPIISSYEHLIWKFSPNFPVLPIHTTCFVSCHQNNFILINVDTLCFYTRYLSKWQMLNSSLCLLFYLVGINYSRRTTLQSFIAFVYYSFVHITLPINMYVYNVLCTIHYTLYRFFHFYTDVSYMTVRCQNPMGQQNNPAPRIGLSNVQSTFLRVD